MKFAAGRFWGAAVLALVLGLAASAGAVGTARAPRLAPGQEAALFSLADLGVVDLSVKTVKVEVYVAPVPELSECRRMLARVWEQVQGFYGSLGVNLVYVQGNATPGPLAPARYLRVEILGDREWLHKSFQAFNVAPPFQLRFLQVCRDKCAFAHLPLSMVHISFRRFKEAEFSPDPRDADLNRNWLANLLIHELGHLMGLYHYHEFTDDPVARVPRRRESLPNFMGDRIAFKPELGYVEFQKLMIHSYLGGGKVYQQYRQVNFDPLSYLEQVKRYNGFHERVAKAGKMARKVKKGKVGTLGGRGGENGDN